MGLPGGIIFPFQANGVITAKTYPTALYINKTGTYRIHATCRDRGTGTSLEVTVHVDGVAVASAPYYCTITAGSGVGHDQADNPIGLMLGQVITGVEVIAVGTSWVTLVVQLIEEP